METHAGYLTVKTVSSLFKTKSFPESWCVLFKGRSEWPAQINLYASSSDTSPEKCLKIIYLEQVQWLSASQSGIVGHSFGLVAKGKKYWLAASSDQECQGWIFALCCVNKALFDSKEVLGPSLSLIGYSIPADDSVVIQSNSLYTSSSEMHSFGVVADSSSDCHRHNIRGQLCLQVESGNVTLISTEGKIVISWPIRMFREYGYSANNVFFYTGSRTSTGVGSFHFTTTEGKAINDAVNDEAKKIEMLDSRSESKNVYLNEPSVSVGQRSPDQTSGRQASNPQRSPKLGHESTESGFSERLNNVLSHRGAEPVAEHSPVERTVSSGSSKEGIRKAKEEKKKLEKLEKQQKKEREKEEKRRKKLEKQEAKNSKGKKSGLSENTSVSESVTDEYAAIDSTYAEANEFPLRLSGPAPPPKPAQEMDGQIYNDPWENKPFPSPPVSPANPHPEDKKEDVYALPERKTNGGLAKLVGGDAYEDVDSSNGGKKVPPPVPPKNLGVEDEEEDNSNVYDHFHAKPSEESTAHIYGMESASAPFNPEENPYEATGNPYEINEMPNSQAAYGGGIYEQV